MTPVHWRVLECIFQKDGFTFRRTRGSHCVYAKEGILRPVIIPRYEEVDPDIIKNNMRSAGMSRERYFHLLAECKSRG